MALWHNSTMAQYFETSFFEAIGADEGDQDNPEHHKWKGMKEHDTDCDHKWITCGKSTTRLPRTSTRWDVV